MSWRHLWAGPLSTWLLAAAALHLLPRPTIGPYGTRFWGYVSADYLSFLALWTLCFLILFRTIAKGVGGLTELPLPITHRHRLQHAVPLVSGMLLLFFLFSRAPVHTALAAGLFGGRELRIWMRKRRAGRM